MGGLRVHYDRRCFLAEGLGVTVLRCVPYAPGMQEAWDRFALSHGTIFHSTAFRRILLESFDYQCGYRAFVDEQSGEFKALLPLVMGRNLGLKRVAVSLPFVNHLDVCAVDEESCKFVLNAVTDLQQKMHLKSVELRLKNQDLNLQGWQPHLQNFTFVLPLLDSEEATLAQASASCRNHVRKTYKNEWFEVSFDPGRLPDFYPVYVRRMKQLGSPAPSKGFFERFFRYLPENAVLLTVLDKADGRVVGGMLLLKDPANATLYYPFGANLVEYNHQYLNNFMYWEAVRFGIRQGMKFLDLGRSPDGSGTYQYKLQWGARPEQLKYLYHGNGGGKIGPPDREQLGFLIELWKGLPVFITGPVGKKLIRYVMP